MKDKRKEPLINVMESLIEFNPDETEEIWFKFLRQSIEELKKRK